jgi:hypothetical protein
VAIDKRGRDPQVEANAIIMRCIESGLETMGGSATAIFYIESISGVSFSDIPQDPENFAWALRHVYRFGSVVILKNIVEHLNASTSASDEVLGRVRTFSESLAESIKSIESGIV